MWYRVFCRSETQPAPAELGTAPGRTLTADFRGDDLGWTVAQLRLGTGSPVVVERYLTGADDLRHDLNTWAAWLETQDFQPNHSRLMEHVIQSKQLVTVRKPADSPDESAAEDVCRRVCQLIADRADGVYQVEGDGWYAPDGEKLLQEY